MCLRRLSYLRLAFGTLALLLVVAAANGEVRVTTTNVADTPIKQVMAEDVLDVPAHDLLAVLSDVEHYASFMPYIVESSILARDANSIINYQRVEFPILGVAPRHYAIRMRTESGTGTLGRAVYRIRWTLAEAKLPPASSAVALTVDNGFWHLEDLGGEGNRTRVVYCVFTNPGGNLPGWIINLANAEAVPRLFDAVRNAARTSRYRTATPSSPAAPSAKLLEAPTSCHG